MCGFALDKPVLLVPNAVESDFLPVGYRRAPVVPPVVGYFGHLADAWFDWEAFVQIAEACAQYRFEIIGHSAPQGLKLPGNVRLLGPKPWHELYRYASRWSAAIIPFRMGPLADGVDPIKIYEYLSFGLPVVSFRMPQIERYPCTATVDSVSDFCIELKVACSMEPDGQLIGEFIAANSWEIRAQELLNLIRDSGNGS
nr:glycosyltransferase [Halomonas campisalis]